MESDQFVSWYISTKTYREKLFYIIFNRFAECGGNLTCAIPTGYSPAIATSWYAFHAEKLKPENKNTKLSMDPPPSMDNTKTGLAVTVRFHGKGSFACDLNPPCFRNASLIIK